MNYLYTYIENKNLKAGTKLFFALLIPAVLSAAAGFILWRALGFLLFPGTDCMLSFIALPALTAYFVCLVFLTGKPFHNGRPPENR